MDDVLDIVTEPEEVKGASITLRQRVMRGDDLLVEAQRARRFRQRRPGAADSEAAARRHEGRSATGRSNRVVRRHDAASYIDVMMSASGFALFDTAIGCCGIVWSERGIAGVQLAGEAASARPEAASSAAFRRRARLRRRHSVQRAIDDIVALLGGERRDLSDVAPR